MKFTCENVSGVDLNLLDILADDAATVFFRACLFQGCRNNEIEVNLMKIWKCII